MPPKTFESSTLWKERCEYLASLASDVIRQRDELVARILARQVQAEQAGYDDVVTYLQHMLNDLEGRDAA